MNELPLSQRPQLLWDALARGNKPATAVQSLAYRCLIAVVAAAILPGCEMLSWNSPQEVAATTAVESSSTAALDNVNWVQAVEASSDWSSSPSSATGPGYRWRNPALEALRDTPAMRKELNAAAAGKDAIRAANAAMVLARWQADVPVAPLAAAVRNIEIKLAMRQAAAESLGRLNEKAALLAISECLDELGRFEGEGQARYLPEVHAELLRGLARQENATDNPHLLAALRSPAAPARLAALSAWRSSPAEVAESVLDMRHDPDSSVRCELLQILAQREDSSAEEFATAALTDADLRVRRQAIAALGEIGGEAARARLQKLTREQPELVRVAAVAALSQAGDLPGVLDRAADESWAVRLTVAQALAQHPEPAALTAARQMAQDASTQVQQQLVESMEEWPLEQAGLVLLDVVEFGGYTARKLSVEQLRRRWDVVQGFPADAPQPRRDEVLAQYRQEWSRQFPARSMPSATAAAAEILQQPVSADTPADQPDAAQAFIDSLQSPRLEDRRGAAARLAEESRRQPLSAAAVERIVETSQAEPDAAVFRDLLTAVESNAGEPALRLALAGLSHPHSDIRRRGCDHLRLHGGRQHASALLPALEDDDQVVVRAAVLALGRIGRAEDAEAIAPLTAADSHSLRLDAAAALCRLGSSTGKTALERLAHDRDAEIRRRTATLLGELGDPAALALLVAMLDDRLGVEQAALVSLEQIVGRDVTAVPDSPPLSLAERIDGWKKWWREQAQP
ncbi:MAG: HEAT repeat domain-containing protein [Pirellulales bacterium]